MNTKKILGSCLRRNDEPKNDKEEKTPHLRSLIFDFKINLHCFDFNCVATV
jgi:hypothetical protein